jgi:putative FmdB family regulatory protein
MPIYEYICQDCGKRFECLLRNRQDAQAIVCSHCGSGSAERIFSTFGLGGGKAESGSSSGSCRTCSTGTCSTCR